MGMGVLRAHWTGGIDAVERVFVIGLLGIGLGALASLGATGFVAAVEWLNDAFWVSARSRMMSGNWWWLPWMTILVPAAGGLMVGVLNRWVLPGGRVHGPPDAIEATQLGDGKLGLRAGLASAGAGILSLGSGASVGQYGPLVHIGATLGSRIGRWLPGGERDLGTIGIGCGVASAIATAFNAPISGILFAHEVVLRHYSLRAFAPITVASTIGFVLTNYVFEKKPLFRIASAPDVTPPEFASFIVLGIAGALVAVAFMHAIALAGRMARTSHLPVMVRPALGGALLGVMALWLPEVLGIGKEALRFAIIPQAFNAGELGMLVIAKIAATALCLGFGFAGGSFSPALVIGALFGALAGDLAAPLVPGAADSMEVYAICGMAAVTSSVIGGPITTIMIVFELTRNYELTTAVMVSVVFANLVSFRLFGRSMFDEMLRARGSDLSMGRDRFVLEQNSVEPYVDQDYIVARPGEERAALRDRLVDNDANEAQLVSSDGDYLGTITLNALLTGMLTTTEGPADDLAEIDPYTLRTDTSIRVALKQAEASLGRLLPVLEPGEGSRLVGVIPRRVIIRAYRKTMSDIRREEHAA